MADFKLGRIKFKWRGNWAGSTSYLIDDVVKYGGNSYVCIQNHTSPASETSFYTSPGAYTSYWSLQAEALFFKGAYANSTWYKLNDVVSYGGKQYRCTTAHTSSSLVLNQSNFEQFVDGLTFRGDYASDTQYRLNDIVKYGGRQYRVTTEHTSASGGDANIDLSNFTLYQEGLAIRGNWATSTYYRLDDLVKFGAYQYRCVEAHTSGAADTDFDQAKFNVYSEGLQWEDTYDASTVYQKGDVVSYGGYTYTYVNDDESSGNTPTDNSYWDIITTGYKNQGTYSHGTAYKTGDVVQYGGNSYVCNTNHTNQYPANTDGTTNTSYWDLSVEGFDWQGTYDAATIYNIGDVVEYSSSSYVMIADRNVGTTPGTDATKWQLIAQGSTTNVLTTRGDIIVRDATQTTRLPIGVAGSYLTTDGSDVVWSNAEGANVKWVANSGSDSNPGTEALPYKTIYYALSQLNNTNVIEIESIAGGTGGTPGVFDVTQASTTGSGTGFTARITTDGSSTPTIQITNGGLGHAEGDTITINGVGSPTASTNITFDVKSVSIGDVLYVKNGVYKETLPLRVPAGCTVQGESLRGTEIRPGSGTGHQIATITSSSTLSGATDGTYNYVHQSSTSGDGAGIVVNVTVSSGALSGTPTIYHGGYGYVVSDTITISAAQLGAGGTGDITLTVASLENNNASNMWLVNNQTNIVQMSMRQLTGTPTAGGTSKAAVISLDPDNNISTTSPYIQNCTSFNTNATGIQIDGNLQSGGNKSILANDFTQINSDGIGVHAKAGGRGEMVSVFTYYCDKSFFAEDGGFIRCLNCSSAYGEKGAEATGTLATETPVSVSARGEMLKYDSTTFVGAATESDIQDTVTTSGTPTAAAIVGDTSGATATIIRTNISLDYIHIENRTGNFQQGETVTITKDDSSTYQVDLDGTFGDSTAAQTGQIGPLIAVDSSDGTLGSANVITVGSNIVFAGDAAKYYRVSAVSETNTGNETALIRLTESVTTGRAIADNEVGSNTVNFSNVRLTGHDFLDIGTGGFADTNYPSTPTQPADQADEITETNGGRVYFSSTDQKGDFRIGELFKIEQATGVATLNADAFDLSGLNELQLGSIGAELGATINEFSTDETLANDANSAVPTERAVKGYLTRDKAGTGAWVPPTGTTGERPTGGNLYTGAIRYNSTLVTWEGYNGTQWTGLGGGNPWSTITFDGSTVETVAANDRNFVDCSSAAGSINLPASPLVGDQVSFIDIAGNADTNNITLNRNTKKIQGLEENMTVSTVHAGFCLVYTGTTYGWVLRESL
jgi:hypothetical protein